MSVPLLSWSDQVLSGHEFVTQCLPKDDNAGVMFDTEGSTIFPTDARNHRNELLGYAIGPFACELCRVRCIDAFILVGEDTASWLHSEWGVPESETKVTLGRSANLPDGEMGLVFAPDFRADEGRMALIQAGMRFVHESVAAIDNEGNPVVDTRPPITRSVINYEPNRTSNTGF